MGQIVHGSATTTEAVRRAIQNSEASLRAFSKCYGINQKTVAKWKKRGFVADLPIGSVLACNFHPVRRGIGVQDCPPVLISICDHPLAMASGWRGMKAVDTIARVRRAFFV